jgi:DNA-directed RNA polymerase specialized sigma24 family protein
MARDLLNASDADLLSLAGCDRDAFAVFYHRYERLVVGWLVRSTGRAELAADLAAEVFAAAYVAAPGFRAGPEPAGAWLLGIARHKLLRSLRRDRIETSARRRLAVERPEVSDDQLAAIDELCDCGLLALLEDLPADQRDADRRQGRLPRDRPHPGCLGHHRTQTREPRLGRIARLLPDAGDRV